MLPLEIMRDIVFMPVASKEINFGLTFQFTVFYQFYKRKKSNDLYQALLFLLPLKVVKVVAKRSAKRPKSRVNVPLSVNLLLMTKKMSTSIIMCMKTTKSLDSDLPDPVERRQKRVC